MGDPDVVDLLVAVEHLVAAHRDELDILNVFPVPDADTGRNVLATVRAARAAAEQAAPDEVRSHAVRGALQGARGNAGVLTSQLLRALLEEGEDWPTRLARADTLARAAVAHPVEGSFLTAVGAAAAASAGATGAAAQLRAATAAAHAAVAASPTQLEVLARAGVVDAGARAAALVLEAVTAHVTGTAPDPPPVDVPAGGPRATTCTVDDARYEVMYLLTPEDDDTVDRVRDGLDRIGGSVVVVEADRLVSVHVHTDDIGAALEVGLSHGRPHDVRVEDLHEGARAAARRGTSAPTQEPGPAAVGLVVGTDGDTLARLAADTGATTVPLGAGIPTRSDLRAAVRRTGRDLVLLLPGAADLAIVGDGVDGVTVLDAVDGPATLLAALAVLDPTAPDEAALRAVANGVREGAVLRAGGGWRWHRDGGLGPRTDDPATALDGLLADLGGEPELVTLLLGEDVTVAQQDAAAAAVERRWPDAELDVIDAGLRRATFAVGCE